MKPPRTRRTGAAAPQGFALVAVLVTLAVMTVVVAGLAFKVDRWREQTADLQRWADEQEAEQSALAVALHGLATRPPGPGGWGEPGAEPSQQLRGDGREYAAAGGGRFAVQDSRGLLSVAVPEAALLRQLLTGLGLPLPRADAMVDVLEDYQDTDDLRRLNGAERDEYAALNLPPPRNDWIVGLEELRAMPLWRDELAQRPELLAWLSPRRSGGLNVNTAPPSLLRAMLPNAPPEQLDRLLQLRRLRPFVDDADLLRQTGLRLATTESQLWVANQMKVQVRAEGATRGHAYNLALTPRRLTGPWMILERLPARISPNDATTPAARYPFAGSANAEPDPVAPAAR